MAASAQLDVQKKTAHALEQERANVLKQRADWLDAQLDFDPEQLVFIDETSLSTKRGARCRVGVPHEHWKTTTFTGALLTAGLTAPFVHDGATSGVVLQTYVSQMLVPTLLPGDIVILDNLPAHWMPGARRAVDDVPAAL